MAQRYIDPIPDEVDLTELNNVRRVLHREPNQEVPLGTSELSDVVTDTSVTGNAAHKTLSTSANRISKLVEDEKSDENALSELTLECPICLQSCIHPAQLPCGHIFCFLCIKGVAYKNRRCAMCRRDIPTEFLENPQLVTQINDKSKTTEDGFQWFYEGRNGWWQYDDRTSQDIEDSFKKGEKSCAILVAGYVYNIDLEAMLQQRQNEPTRCRRVKRDFATIAKKGIAGLRIGSNVLAVDATYESEINSHQVILGNSQHARTSGLDTSNVTIEREVVTPLEVIANVIGAASAIADSQLINIESLSSNTSSEDILSASGSNENNLISRSGMMPSTSGGIASTNVRYGIHSPTENPPETTQTLENSEESIDLLNHSINGLNLLSVRDINFDFDSAVDESEEDDTYENRQLWF